MKQTNPLLATLLVAVMMASVPSAAQIEASEGPVGVSVGIGSGGAGNALAACDILATACAGAAAAVLHQEAEAEGVIPILGPGTIEVSADFGIALAAHSVRIVLTGSGDGEASVTSTYEEEKVVKGDDKCQWYNPADWAGHCDPDETVTYHVDKEDASACPALYSTFLDPSLAGDWIAESCSASAGDSVVCMKAEANANAASNVGDAKAGPVDASNCDGDAAVRMAEILLGDVSEADSVDEMDEANQAYFIPIQNLPDGLKQTLLQGARAEAADIIEEAMQENYSGPDEGRAIIHEAMMAALDQTLDGYDGQATVYFTPTD